MMIDTYCVLSVNEWIVDSDNVNVIVLNSVSENETADTTETVDSDFNWCHFVYEIEVLVDHCAARFPIIAAKRATF